MKKYKCNLKEHDVFMKLKDILCLILPKDLINFFHVRNVFFYFFIFFFVYVTSTGIARCIAADFDWEHYYFHIYCFFSLVLFFCYFVYLVIFKCINALWLHTYKVFYYLILPNYTQFILISVLIFFFSLITIVLIVKHLFNLFCCCTICWSFISSYSF